MNDYVSKPVGLEELRPQLLLSLREKHSSSRRRRRR